MSKVTPESVWEKGGGIDGSILNHENAIKFGMSTHNRLCKF